MYFKNGVKNIQVVAYNGAHTVYFFVGIYDVYRLMMPNSLLWAR